MIYLGCITHASKGSIATVGGTDSATGALKHFTEAQAIAAIDAGMERFAVRDDKGHQADVRVTHNGTRRFLETRRDGVVTDNRGRLPVCRHAQVVKEAAASYKVDTDAISAKEKQKKAQPAAKAVKKTA